MVLIPPGHIRDLNIAVLRRRIGLQRRHNLMVAAVLLEEDLRAQEQHRRRTWVRPWLQRRVFLGQYDTLMNELRLEDRGGYKSFLRMESHVFIQILVRVEAGGIQIGQPPEGGI